MLGFESNMEQLIIHSFAFKVMEAFLCQVLSVSSYALWWLQDISAYAFCVLVYDI